MQRHHNSTWPIRILLFFFLIALAVGSLLFYRSLIGTELDVRLQKLTANQSEFAPDSFGPEEWVFWCISGDPGVISTNSHFVAAAEYARKNGLTYLGPSKPDGDTRGWPIIFVRADGTFLVLNTRRYRFEWQYGSVDCWHRGRSKIRVVGSNLLVVEGAR